MCTTSEVLGPSELEPKSSLTGAVRSLKGKLIYRFNYDKGYIKHFIIAHAAKLRDSFRHVLCALDPHSDRVCDSAQSQTINILEQTLNPQSYII